MTNKFPSRVAFGWKKVPTFTPAVGKKEPSCCNASNNQLQAAPLGSFYFYTPFRRHSPPKTRRVAKIAMSSQNQDQIDGSGSAVSIPPEFSEIVVVRHGETSFNASRIFQGHMDSELNDVGRKQASVVGDKLSKKAKYAAIYASDLKRASETAQIIATTCNLPEVIKDPTLRERHIGDLQGLALQDAAKLKPKAYKILMSHNRDQEIPGGGESQIQLYESARLPWRE